MDIENEFLDNSFNEYLIKKAEFTRVPITGTFELTPICNMKCKMCYIQQDSKKVYQSGGLKSIEFWEKVINDAIDNGMLFLLFTGGEIFTYPGFKELYERVIKKPIYIVLNTNATLLNEENIQWLAKNPPRRLNISLYGSNADTYENLCQYRQGYSQVMKAFELLQQYHIDYRVHSVLVPSNINDYDGMIDICNNLKAPLQMSNYMFPPLRKDNDIALNDERFSPKEMAKVSIRYNKSKCRDDKVLWKQLVEDTIDEITHYKDDYRYGFDKILCKNGICSFWVNWKGEMSGCGVSDENVYNLEKYSFQYAWDEITKYINNVHLSKACAICKYRAICPVCLASAVCETGSVDGTPEYLCEYCEEYYKLILEEYERLSHDE